MTQLHTPPQTKHQRVVIIGGGFAGLSLARDLRKQPVEVVLVDKNNYHTFQPLLYQVATAGLEPEEITYPLRSIVQGQKNVRFRLGEVTKVEWQQKRVYFKDDQSLSFDYLILAAGATPNYFNIEGASENSFTLKSLSDAIQLRSHILHLFEKADQDPSLIKKGILNFVIVGGGPTGVEMAGALIELIQHTFKSDYPHLPLDKARVILIEAGDSLISMFKDESSAHALERLQEYGVHVALGERVVRISKNAVYLKSRKMIYSTTTIWAVGVKAAPLADVLDVEQTRGGRIVVDMDLRIPSRPYVFVIGDMAAAMDKKGNLLPQLASVAQQAGKHVAKQITSELKGDQLKPFTFKNPGQMATIGRHAAVTEFPGDIRFAGTFAWLTWLVLHLAVLFGFRNRMHVLISWMCSYFSNCRGARLILDNQTSRTETKTSYQKPHMAIPQQPKPLPLDSPDNMDRLRRIHSFIQQAEEIRTTP